MLEDILDIAEKGRKKTLLCTYTNIVCDAENKVCKMYRDMG